MRPFFRRSSTVTRMSVQRPVRTHVSARGNKGSTHLVNSQVPLYSVVRNLRLPRMNAASITLTWAMFYAEVTSALALHAGASGLTCSSGPTEFIPWLSTIYPQLSTPDIRRLGISSVTSLQHHSGSAEFTPTRRLICSLFVFASPLPYYLRRCIPTNSSYIDGSYGPHRFGLTSHATNAERSRKCTNIGSVTRAKIVRNAVISLQGCESGGSK
ncbi:hypothetical protein BC629DRAFT_270227 [Irpex lacteus]|nr:hypothetical protein BC629DRAFT_270227 [Irpex lacteus]